MKYTRTMPKDDEQKTFKLVSEGEHKFQVTDIYSENDAEITLKCEVVSTVDQGMTIFYRIANDDKSQYFWLTKLFLKCIGCQCEGAVVIDTDEFIGRQFTGEVKHSSGKDNKTYANIKKLIFKDEPQPVKVDNPSGVADPKDIVWDEK